MVDYRFTLELTDYTVQKRVTVTQGEVAARRFIVNFSENGKPYALNPFSLVAFRMTTPSGKDIFNDCTVKGNSVEFIPSSVSVAEHGLCDAVIEIYGNEPYSALYSPRFEMYITENKFSNSTVEGSNEFTALQKAADNYVLAMKELNGPQGVIATAKEQVELAKDEVENAKGQVELAKAEAEKAQAASTYAEERADEALANANYASQMAGESQQSAEAAKSYSDSSAEWANIAYGHARTAQTAETNAKQHSESAKSYVSDAYVHAMGAISAASDARVYAEEAIDARDGAVAASEEARQSAERLEELISNIETGLDGIIALQENLIGGGN